MNLSTIKRRLDALEAKRMTGPRFVHCISAADGDTETVARMKRDHIDAGLGSESDLWVHLRRLTDVDSPPTIVSHPHVGARQP